MFCKEPKELNPQKHKNRKIVAQTKIMGSKKFPIFLVVAKYHSDLKFVMATAGRLRVGTIVKPIEVESERKELPKNRMSKPGKAVWYGYSIFIPKDFVSLGRANTILSQAKVEKNNTPLWALTFNDSPYLLYSDGKHCKLGGLSGWRGKWNDIVVYADYSQSGKSVYFQILKNNKLLCCRATPIMPRHIKVRSQKIGIKYGIYSSFVSRYLDAKKTKPVNLSAYRQTQSTGTTSKSLTPTPFKYDWGVTLPTHVIYYDEMRYGSQRDRVDVRLLEKAGQSPID